MRGAAAIAVASASVAKLAITSRMGCKQSSSKIPPAVVRSVVLVQAWLRHRAFLRSFGEAALKDEALDELAPPPPLTAVALYMCRRMRNPTFVDMNTEAMSVSDIVVSKSNIFMDTLAEILWFYDGSLPDDHAALVTVREKLTSLIVEAHEVLQAKAAGCDTPAKVHSMIEDTRKAFKVLPELEAQVFFFAQRRMEEVTKDVENMMESEIARSITTFEYDANRELLERFYGAVETHLREELARARLRRLKFLERELETRWSRPFAGPLPPHTHAAQRYTEELGLSPKVQEFCVELKRHCSALEAQFEVQLSDWQSSLRNLTARRKDAKARSLVQDLDSRLTDATIRLQGIIEEALVNLGSDNQKVCRKARMFLSQESHTAVFAMFAENQAEKLRQEISGNDLSVEASDRRCGIAFALSAALNELASTHPFQTELREEFIHELGAVVRPPLTEDGIPAQRFPYKASMAAPSGSDSSMCTASPVRAEVPTFAWSESVEAGATKDVEPVEDNTTTSPSDDKQPWSSSVHSPPAQTSGDTRSFPSSCLRGFADQQSPGASWATACKIQDMYALRNKLDGEIASRTFAGADLARTTPKKEIASMYASFSVTRHPVCGIGKSKALPMPKEHAIPVIVTSPWLERAEALHRSDVCYDVQCPELSLPHHSSQHQPDGPNHQLIDPAAEVEPQVHTSLAAMDESVEDHSKVNARQSFSKRKAKKSLKGKPRPVLKNAKESQEKMVEDPEMVDHAVSNATHMNRRKPAHVDTQRRVAGDIGKTPQQKSRVGLGRPASAGPSFSQGLASENSDIASMLEGKPHNGIRHKMYRDTGDSSARLPQIFSKTTTDDLRSPAFMCSWFRHSAIGIGPPYRTHCKEQEDCPIWTAMQMLNATLEKNDWNRSYGFQSRQVGKVKKDWAYRGAQLGPELSIRQNRAHATRSQSEGFLDHLPPVNRRRGRQKSKSVVCLATVDGSRWAAKEETLSQAAEDHAAAEMDTATAEAEVVMEKCREHLGVKTEALGKVEVHTREKQPGDKRDAETINAEVETFVKADADPPTARVKTPVRAARTEAGQCAAEERELFAKVVEAELLVEKAEGISKARACPEAVTETNAKAPVWEAMTGLLAAEVVVVANTEADSAAAHAGTFLKVEVDAFADVEADRLAVEPQSAKQNGANRVAVDSAAITQSELDTKAKATEKGEADHVVAEAEVFSKVELAPKKTPAKAETDIAMATVEIVDEMEADGLTAVADALAKAKVCTMEEGLAAKQALEYPLAEIEVAAQADIDFPSARSKAPVKAEAERCTAEEGELVAKQFETERLAAKAEAIPKAKAECLAVEPRSSPQAGTQARAKKEVAEARNFAAYAEADSFVAEAAALLKAEAEVEAWLEQAPPQARLTLNELTARESPKAEDDLAIIFCHTPSVGTWLRSAPKSAHQHLAMLHAPGQEITPQHSPKFAVEAATEEHRTLGFRFSPSVGAWLSSKPARLNLATALVVSSDIFEKATHAARARSSVTSCLEASSESEPQATSMPRQSISGIHCRTNVVATRGHVLNFAQSLTSSIFRNSNTVVMGRAKSQPPLSARQVSVFPVTRTLVSAATSSIVVSAAAPAASLEPVRPRPFFRKQHSPIPAEEDAFFD